MGFVSVLLVLLVLAVVVAVVVGMGVIRASKSSSNASNLRSRGIPASVAMITTSLQVIGLLADANFSWSSNAQSTLGIFNAANVDINLFASECSLDSFHTKYVVSVLLPLLAIVCVFGALVLLKVLSNAGLSFCGLAGLAESGVKTLFDAVLFTVAPLLYIPMSRATFILFDCTKLPNDDLVLDADPGVACLDSAWWAVAPVGMIGLIVYVLGIPAYFLWCLVGNRNHLTEPQTFARLGSLYKLFRIPYFWGGVADLGKRLAIVVAAVFVSDRQLVQIGLLLAIFLATSYTVRSLKPYYFPLCNTVDFRLTLILIVLLLLGGASHAQRNNLGSSDTPIFVGVILALIVLSVIAVHSVVLDVLQIKRARDEKYSANRDRKTRLARLLQLERGDLDPEAAAKVARLVEELEHDEFTAGGGVEFETLGVAMGGSSSSSGL